MIICPLCEHEQSFGIECEQCGKDLGGLAGLAPPPPAVEPVAGLEQREGAGDVDVDPIAELELTAHAPVEAPSEQTPDLERTALASSDDAGPPTRSMAISVGQVMCRFCQQVQPLQRLCERCGMALPQLNTAPTPAAPNDGAALRRCRSCGARGRAGQRCGGCGHLV